MLDTSRNSQSRGNHRILIVHAAICALLVVGSALQAQQIEQKAPYNSGEAADGQPMSAEESLVAFDAIDLPIKSVFASEPMIQNPIAVNWDGAGRMWLAENFTYAERPQRFDLELSDRVVVLEDDDRDGKADRRTVFLQGLKVLTGVEVDARGVWLMCPPTLLFVPDANQDLTPDGPAEVVLDGFDIPRDNYHNFANGLRWGPDGWLYGRCGGSCPARVYSPNNGALSPVAVEGGVWRYHPETKCFESLVHGTTNPWGHDWNEWGELFFINTVNGHLWHVIPGAHLDRPFTLDPNPRVYEPLQMHADHWHFDTGKRWTESRDGAAQVFGGGHAHAGLMFCRSSGLLPDAWVGNLVTWNMHGYQLNRERLARDGSGYVASHAGDALHTRDRFARIIDVRQGPDGAMYLIDWCDTGECHEADGVHRTSGRVFRFASRPTTPVRPVIRWLPAFNELDGHRTKHLVESVVVKAQSQNTAEQLEALENAWELHRSIPSSELTAERLQVIDALSRSSNEHLRSWSIRLLADHWPIDDCMGLHPIVQQLLQLVDPNRLSDLRTEQSSMLERLKSAARDESGLVRLATASTLPRLLPENRVAVANELMQNPADADDHNLPLMVWFGLMNVVDSQPDALAAAALKSKWSVASRSIVRGLVEYAPDGSRLEFILRGSCEVVDLSSGNALLKGAVEGLAGFTFASAPDEWPQIRHELQARIESANGETAVAEAMAARQRLIQALDLAFDSQRAAAEARELILNPAVNVGLRRSALEAYIGSGQLDCAEICVKLLSDGKLNSTALRGIAQGVEPELAAALIKAYKKFHASGRAEVIEVLCSRESFALELLRSIPSGPIAKEEITAYHQFQLRMLDSEAVRKLAMEHGLELAVEVRQTALNAANPIQRLAELREELSSTNEFDYDLGRVIFQKQCAGCHRLFGEGGNFGPDLTGGNRDNLEYLLTNLVMPSAEVSPSYQVSTVLTTDGRVMTGVIRRKTANALELQSPTGRSIIPLSQIEALKGQGLSPMPDGILDQLTAQERANLIGYLRKAKAGEAK